MPTKLTAAQFIKRLKAISSAEEAKKSLRYFKTGKGEYGEGDKFIGVRMGQVFSLAKEFIEMTPDEIEKLLDSPIHEARAGALSIMGQQVKRKKTPPARRKELFDLYLRRHDRVNNWDLVDLGALYVVGPYLFDKPRDILYKLARSKNLWERRTAIVATGPLIKRGDVTDTFRIAELLLKDDQDLVHKGAGWMLRTAGQSQSKQLLAFLDKHAATMPRTALRYAMEKLNKKTRDHYLGARKARWAGECMPAGKAKPKVAKDVSAYLAAVPKESRAALEKLRQTIKAAVPDAVEVISYQIPTFKLDGRMLVSYAAFSAHCSFFPGSGPIETHDKELRTYQTSKGTIRFRPERPLSASLIKKLLKTRIGLSNAALKKRTNGKRTKKVK